APLPSFFPLLEVSSKEQEEYATCTCDVLESHLTCLAQSDKQKHNRLATSIRQATPVSICTITWKEGGVVPLTDQALVGWKSSYGTKMHSINGLVPLSDMSHNTVPPESGCMTVNRSYCVEKKTGLGPTPCTQRRCRARIPRSRILSMPP